MKKEIKIKPEGWVESLVIEYGGAHMCGREEAGMGIYRTEGGKYTPGGVLMREDMVKLIAIFEQHLKDYPLEEKEI